MADAVAPGLDPAMILVGDREGLNRARRRVVEVASNLVVQINLNSLPSLPCGSRCANCAKLISWNPTVLLSTLQKPILLTFLGVPTHALRRADQGTVNSAMPFSTRGNQGPRGEYALGEAILFTTSNFAKDREKPFRSAAGHMIATAAGLAMLATGALAAVPGDPIPLLAPASPPPATTASYPLSPAPIGSPIRTRIEHAAGLTIGGAKLRGALLRQFYAAHDFEPVWAGREAQAEALLRAVGRAGEHGLDPELFHAGLLRQPGALSPLDRELLLSDAFLGYADALARGAVPIESRLDDEDLTPEPIDVAAALTQAINSPDPAAAIEGLAPRSPAYSALRRALQSHRAAYPDAAASRAPLHSDPGKRNEARRRAIEVSLERLRWLPRQLPADRIWVNITTAHLEFYRDGRPVFTARVVVGEPGVDKQTPESQMMITSLLFNPPWNVPYSIATRNILPRLAQDPEYLRRQRMVMRPNGAIQQLPGAGSALGLLKFESVNRFDVYLHDTPTKALFNRDNRFQSNGCVRVQNARDLGALLLEEPAEAINKAIAPGTTNRRMLPKPIPVFLVYQTAFLGSDGEIAFAPDIYHRDEGIWRRLNRAQQAPVAQHEPASQRRS